MTVESRYTDRIDADFVLAVRREPDEPGLTWATWLVPVSGVEFEIVYEADPPVEIGPGVTANGKARLVGVDASFSSKGLMMAIMPEDVAEAVERLAAWFADRQREAESAVADGDTPVA